MYYFSIIKACLVWQQSVEEAGLSMPGSSYRCCSEIPLKIQVFFKRYSHVKQVPRFNNHFLENHRANYSSFITFHTRRLCKSCIYRPLLYIHEPFCFTLKYGMYLLLYLV